MGDGDQRPWDPQEAMVRLTEYTRLLEVMMHARDDAGTLFSACKLGIVSRVRKLLDNATGPEAVRCETTVRRLAMAPHSDARHSLMAGRLVSGRFWRPGMGAFASAPSG
jgi:hypothetical protein